MASDGGAVSPQGGASGSTAAQPQPQQAKSPYAAFCEMLRHPSAKPLIAKCKVFVDRFPKDLPRDEAASRVHSFLTDVEGWMFSDIVVFAAEADEAGRALATESLEKFIISRLHPKIFAADPADQEADAKLYSHLRVLTWIDFRHLGIPPVDSVLIPRLIEELQRIDDYKAPCDKLVCILNSCRVINDMLKRTQARDGRERILSADDFLPLLIYAVIKANPPRFHSNIEFAAAFRHPSRLVGEDAYYVTALQSAKEFARVAGPGSLEVSQEEFDRLCNAAAAELDEPETAQATEVAKVSGISSPVVAASRSSPAGSNETAAAEEVVRAPAPPVTASPEKSAATPVEQKQDVVAALPQSTASACSDNGAAVTPTVDAASQSSPAGSVNAAVAAQEASAPVRAVAAFRAESPAASSDSDTLADLPAATSAAATTPALAGQKHDVVVALPQSTVDLATQSSPAGPPEAAAAEEEAMALTQANAALRAESPAASSDSDTLADLPYVTPAAATITDPLERKQTVVAALPESTPSACPDNGAAGTATMVAASKSSAADSIEKVVVDAASEVSAPPPTLAASLVESPLVSPAGEMLADPPASTPAIATASHSLGTRHEAVAALPQSSACLDNGAAGTPPVDATRKSSPSSSLAKAAVAAAEDVSSPPAMVTASMAKSPAASSDGDPLACPHAATPAVATTPASLEQKHEVLAAMPASTAAARSGNGTAGTPTMDAARKSSAAVSVDMAMAAALQAVSAPATSPADTPAAWPDGNMLADPPAATRATAAISASLPQKQGAAAAVGPTTSACLANGAVGSPPADGVLESAEDDAWCDFASFDPSRPMAAPPAPAQETADDDFANFQEAGAASSSLAKASEVSTGFEFGSFVTGAAASPGVSSAACPSIGVECAASFATGASSTPIVGTSMPIGAQVVGGRAARDDPFAGLPLGGTPSSYHGPPAGAGLAPPPARDDPFNFASSDFSSGAVDPFGGLLDGLSTRQRGLQA